MIAEEILVETEMRSNSVTKTRNVIKDGLPTDEASRRKDLIFYKAYKDKKMKRFIQILALLMIIASFVLAGCQTSPAPVEPKAEEIAAPAEAEEAEDEEAEAEEVEITEVEVLGHTFV